ncbi:MAG: hypothetical protein KKA90_03775 [Nanoarchaeota archaeon]|nr:hypothetical protein [Nanoarchaeota archaeon]
MRVILIVNKEKRELDLPTGSTAAQALAAAGLIPQSYLVARGKAIIPDTAELLEQDQLTAIKIVSGG